MRNKILISILVIVAASIFVYLKLSVNPEMPNIDSVSFSCVADGDCQLVETSCCNNNAPTQNGCISKNEVRIWEADLQNYCNRDPVNCPMFYMEGNYSCFCKDKTCWTNFTSRSGQELYIGVLRGK